MKRSRSIIWGVALVILGIIWGGNALEIFNVELFFDGWWTLFIIIPSFIGLFSDNNKNSNLICLIIGVLLLLSCQDIIGFDVFWKLILPIIFLILGISLVFNGITFKKAPKSLGTKINAIFAAHDIKVNEEYKGNDLTMVFGGIDLDLRKAEIKSDVTINVTCVFGGAEIYVPENVKVKIEATSLFGGVDKPNLDDNDNSKYTIYINATCVFGGIEIKR